jgi:hypothetical protein
LQGIGYAGWFAAAQAEADADGRVMRASVRYVGEIEQPISPEALTAARALEASSCHDPRALRYVARYLLNSSYHRNLGIRLMERAVRAAEGADPLTELAYGTKELEDTRRDLERELRTMPIHYALAGMSAQAEQAVDRLLAGLPPPGGNERGVRFSDTHYVAGRVYDIVT